MFSIASEPISARRLVHVLIKLGKISKSTNAQQQNASPAMLPEDREVTDIMTHSRLTGVSFCFVDILFYLSFCV